MKSSCLRPETKRPVASVTVAVTLISSTPVRNLNPSLWPDGFAGCDCARTMVPANATSEAVISVGSDRDAVMIVLFARLLRGRLLHRRGGRAAPIDVRHDARIGAEAHTIPADAASLRDGDRKRRFLACLQLWKVEH